MPRITSMGGGHGLFSTLRAARSLTENVTAVVTVADDGGSSGRIRRELGQIPPGDLRMALAALSGTDDHGQLWEQVLQHRFTGTGALAGHAAGNLLISALVEVLGDQIAALDEVGKLVGVRGRVLPMAPIPLDIEAEVVGLADDPRIVRKVRGQVAVATTPGQVRRVSLIPVQPPAQPESVAAIMDADIVTLGPGSWFSSVLPHLLVPEIAAAINDTDAHRIVVLNLVAEPGETAGFSAERHIHMIARHAPGVQVDTVLVDENQLLDPTERMYLQRSASELGAHVVYHDVAKLSDTGQPTGRHDPEKLAAAFSAITGL